MKLNIPNPLPHIISLFSVNSAVFILEMLIGYLILFLVHYLLPQFYADMFFGAKEFFPFTFQMGMWLPFLIGVHILLDRYSCYRDSKELFKKTCPLIAENVVLEPIHFKQILSTIKPHVKNSVAIAPKVIHQVIMKYQASKSVEQASAMLGSLKDMAHERLESKYSSIRYLSWLIPSLGFMGTVYGISLTVSAVGHSQPDDPALLSNIASNLAIAFDTTLLALVQSSVLIYLASLVETREESAITDLGEYVLENIINRLE